METNHGTLHYLWQDVDCTRDYILSHDIDGFEYDDQQELYICDKDTYDWWINQIKKQEIQDSVFNLIEDEELKLDVYRCAECDLEDQAVSTLKVLRDALEDGEVLKKFDISQADAEDWHELAVKALKALKAL